MSQEASFVNRIQEPFTKVVNSILYDHRLKNSDKGLLATMLSYKAGWSFNLTHLCKQSQDGRDAVRAQVGRLEALGYLRRTVIRKERGHFDSVLYEVFGTPIVTPTPIGFSDIGKSNTSNTYINNTKDKRLAEHPGSEDSMPKAKTVREGRVGISEADLFEAFTEYQKLSPPPSPEPLFSVLINPQEAFQGTDPDNSPPPVEMTPENARKQHFAVKKSMEVSALKNLKQFLGDDFEKVKALIKEYGGKPEKILQKLQSEPATLAALRSRNSNEILTVLTVAVTEAGKHTTGYECNVYWQFFNWLTKRPPQTAIRDDRPAKSPINYLNYLSEARHESTGSAIEEES